MKKKIFTYLGFTLMFFFVLGINQAFAQPPDLPDDPVDTVPIGGLLIAVFFAVGAYFGTRKLRK